MNSRKLKTRAVAALGILVITQNAPGDATLFVFEPEEGSSITKTFHVESSVDLSDFELIVDGNDISPMLGDIEVNVNTTAHIVLTDTYLEVVDGEVSSFSRTFDELGTSSETVVGSQFATDLVQVDGTSEFEGVTVGFTKSPEDEEYEVELLEGELDAELLDGLVAETDLLFLLPEDEVAPGDQWEVAYSEFQELLAPGGDLRVLPENMQEIEGLGAIQERLQEQVLEVWEESFAGSARCTFQGTEELDGLNLAVIEIDIDIETTIDMIPFMEGMLDLLLEEVDLPMELEFEFDILDFSVELESTGELRWNLEAGELYALELSTNGVFELDISMAVIGGDMTPSIEGNFDLSMTQENTVSVDS